MTYTITLDTPQGGTVTLPLEADTDEAMTAAALQAGWQVGDLWPDFTYAKDGEEIGGGGGPNSGHVGVPEDAPLYTFYLESGGDPDVRHAIGHGPLEHGVLLCRQLEERYAAWEVAGWPEETGPHTDLEGGDFVAYPDGQGLPALCLTGDDPDSPEWEEI